MRDWTDYELRRLVELRGMDVPFSKIVEALNRSKDSCIGMMNRCVKASDKMEVDHG